LTHRCRLKSKGGRHLSAGGAESSRRRRETARDRPGFREAHDALEDEFAALAALLCARKHAGLAQADVAERMGVSQPVLARIESS
jgi:ribosome-binding protein aMBF1 (putative translation factor)